jgi:gliding motility-associated-like protein
MNMQQKIIYLLFATALLFAPSFLWAQTVVKPVAPVPTASYTNEEGVEQILVASESYTGETPIEVLGRAPFEVLFSANAEEAEGYSVVCVWTFTNNDNQKVFLTRYDDAVEYEFLSSGSFSVSLKVTYTSTQNPEIIYEYEFSPFTISIGESSLEVPNAFSPNGDGINDYFNVYNVASIISFRASIYNRWGQELYSWGLDEMECEECGWDGTYNGKPVKAGVYFVVVIARGADGIKYEYKKDVNLLRDYNESINP